MATENVLRDQNHVTGLLAQNASGEFKSVKMTDVTDRLLVEAVLNTTGNTVVIDVPTDFEGGPVTVGTAAVEMTFTGTTRTILIQAAHTNTGTIYVGESDVTNAGLNAMAAMMAGESLSISLNDSTAIYAVASVAAQKVYKMATI